MTAAATPTTSPAAEATTTAAPAPSTDAPSTGVATTEAATNRPAARAESLRAWAADAPSPLAAALRRRASELELMAAAAGAQRLAA